MTDHDRSQYIATLEKRLKPSNFWVTDFLSHRLMDVEWSFCCGEGENWSTIKRCAEYSRDILRIIHPQVLDLDECIELTTVSSQAKDNIRELFVLEALCDEPKVTEEQVCNAVTAFFQLVFTRDFA
ncbi:hypothetical protein H8K35_10685 [Undibacterium sp. LX40W]|uniref:Uncharacterized protein n=1 Tax=Undibacterium nitidum TaxID=2762298 RepID=A0A923HMP4_9BURK|nr:MULTISPECIES: hypothetical protein [Undibacterium]MBC3881877.1 hypothetical protein [Undibacterium nitidum]MBC3892126.1 hypothetical protein [Undibacterium sp. LX40W]